MSLLLALVLARVASARADQPPPHARDRAQTSGLGVGVGLGYESGGGAGGHVLYYEQLSNPRWRLAFHLGAGVLDPGRVDPQWGLSTGSFVAFGKRNRLTLGVHAGVETFRYWLLHGQRWAEQPLFGAGVGMGYELVTKRGFILRLNVGPGFYVARDTPFYPRELRSRWNGNLSLGWKLW